MDASAGSFVAVRRLSGSDRAAAFHHSSSGTSPRLFVCLLLFWMLSLLLPRGRCLCSALSVRWCCSGGRDGVDGVDREGAFLRLRAKKGQRCAPLVRFDACAGGIRLISLWLDPLICSRGFNQFSSLFMCKLILIFMFQEECLQRLQNRIGVQYDSSNREHQEALQALWCASFPGTELRGLISEQWKEMGWQGKDPSTDFRYSTFSHVPVVSRYLLSAVSFSLLREYDPLVFWHYRGGGFISLENLLYFARNYPKSFQELLRKQNGDRAIWEYPFAVAGVNITFMLIQMLDLQAENDRAFDILYCITFKLMDQQWLDMHATYMDFNTVMKSTRRQLERELLIEDIQRIEDMPSYRLLAR
ncbi:hypothetical protein HU200_007319 [Digitaria exilis]|uniref:ELMO domain-containing protein n=1 Tax=Digitaria exilis TaxID=1010633 RepID=A0A835FPU4_9POAL|nr:hypothetical protein HU200_007319 [Digitaria exilis]